MGRFGVTFHRVLRRRTKLLKKVRVVKVARITHLPGQQLDLKIAIAERQEIRRKGLLDLSRLAGGDAGAVENLLAVCLIAN